MERLNKRYSLVRSKLIDTIKEQKKVCMTCDVWSSRCQSYIGTTIHYLTPTYKRESYLLAFRQLKARQTNEELAAAMVEVMDEFEITVSKVTHIITDGGSAFCKAFKRFGRSHDSYVDDIPTESTNENDSNNSFVMPYIQNEDGESYVSNIITIFSQSNGAASIDSLYVEQNDVQEDDLDDDPNHGHDRSVDALNDILNSSNDYERTNRLRALVLPPQRRCVPHLLNLCASDFENALSPQAKGALVMAINKAHAIWTFTHRSSRAKTLCYEIIGCVLQVPCVTRWNSRFDAVSRICNSHIKTKVNSLIQRLTAELPSAAHLQILTNADWIVLNEYVRVMEPIATSLDILQGEHNTCQGYILPTLSSMRYRITELQGSTLLQAFKRAALDAIHKRFERHLDINSTNKELVLAAVTNPLFKTGFIENPMDERIARELLQNECINISNENAVEIETNDQNQIIDSDAQNTFFVTFNRTNTRRNSIENDVEAEIGRYLNDVRKNEAILDEYPNIKRIYFEHNTTLASSAPIERVFSQSNLIFRPQRSRMSAENFERALFLKINLSLLENV